VIIGCGRPTPAPPTPTPIPGYVGGEERFAYDSFIQYYKDEFHDCISGYIRDPECFSGVDLDYPGIAIYVGDGIWRFHIQTFDVDISDLNNQPVYYDEEVVEARSLPDRTWEDMCTDRTYMDYEEDYNFYIPDE
jgi:hypothetical protein